MDEIAKYIGCGDAWLEEKAQLVLSCSDAVARGDLTVEEYKEILQDIATTDSIMHDAANLEAKSLFIAAVAGIAQVL